MSPPKNNSNKRKKGKRRKTIRFSFFRDLVNQLANCLIDDLLPNPGQMYHCPTGLILYRDVMKKLVYGLFRCERKGLIKCVYGSLVYLFVPGYYKIVSMFDLSLPVT